MALLQWFKMAVVIYTCFGALSDSANVPLPPVDVEFVLSARDLPNTDELDTGAPDGYVEVSYYETSQWRPVAFLNKTKTLDNNHNPDWAEVFLVPFLDGRGQRLKFRIMDSDTIGQDDEIGNVEVKLKDLVLTNGVKPLSFPIIGSRTKNGQLVVYTKLGGKINDDTDARLLKKQPRVYLPRD